MWGVWKWLDCVCRLWTVIIYLEEHGLVLLPKEEGWETKLWVRIRARVPTLLSAYNQHIYDGLITSLSDLTSKPLCLTYIAVGSGFRERETGSENDLMGLWTKYCSLQNRNSWVGKKSLNYLGYYVTILSR